MNQITLACITGNNEKYITRFLNHFKPFFDEVVIVRACGNQQPDSTLDLAKLQGCITGEYKNKPGNDWPHVDDFAAARNLAFSMASHDLIMWADMDDIASEDHMRKIRECAQFLPAEYDGIEFPYHVPEDGLTVFRERIIRKGRAKWISPIHEHLFFDHEPKLMRITDAKITHAPSGSRKTNDERNLRILESIPTEQRTTSHKFHLFQSLRAVGRMEDAVEQAVALLANPPPDIGKPELYELYIAAGQLAPETNQRAALMLQAVGTDPTRREGYGEMVLCMIGMGRPDDALAYARAMKAMPPLNTNTWNARDKYYGYLGEQLHGMALRALGRVDEADVMETNYFIEHGAKISLIHATRGRVTQSVQARRKWFTRALNPDAIEHIFGLDIDDEHAKFLTVHNHVWTNGKGGPVAAWNAAANKSRGQVLIQVSDDWEPPMHWDRLILDAIGDTSKPSVLAISDGHRKDDLLCMAILTRARYEQQGYMFHPDFFSMYSDNWFSECAFKDGVVIDCRDSITFEHLHPVFGKAEMDETYARSNAPAHYVRGQKTLDRLRSGIKTCIDIEGWCDYGQFYRAVAATIPNGGSFVEVGSWFGQSIILLAQELQNLGKTAMLYCVDTWKGEQNQPAHVATVASHGGSILEKFKQNVRDAGVADMITIIEGDSAESAAHFQDGTLDGCYIDAAHDYDSASKDIAAWYSKVKPNGIWAGHDYPWHEVERAIHEHATANGYSVFGIGSVWVRENTNPESK